MVFASGKAQVYSICWSTQGSSKKLDKYYEKTTDTAAYVIAMCSSFSILIILTLTNSTILVLDPISKLAYFKKHWPTNLLNDVLAYAEMVFEQHYMTVPNCKACHH
jgi:hypothetical protein